MKLKILATVLTTALVASTSFAQTAASLKIATVEVSKIVEQSVRAKKIRDDRDTVVAAARQKKDKKQDELEKANKELEDMKAKAQDPSLSAQGRAAAAAEYRKKLDSLQMDAATFQDALSKEGQEITLKTQGAIEKLGKDVFETAEKVAKAKGYNLVLDTSKGRGVIYQALGADITQEVMSQVDVIK
jgi:Skp family chaperone for outer membrane proteins